MTRNKTEIINNILEILHYSQQKEKIKEMLNFICDNNQKILIFLQKIIEYQNQDRVLITSGLINLLLKNFPQEMKAYYSHLKVKEYLNDKLKD